MAEEGEIHLREAAVDDDLRLRVVVVENVNVRMTLEDHLIANVEKFPEVRLAKEVHSRVNVKEKKYSLTAQ